MLFPWRPETPLVETLRSLTDVQVHKDGSEQRISLRIAPRIEYTFNVFLEDNLDRQQLSNMLYGEQGGIFDVPAWTDVAFLTADCASGSTTLSASTIHSDFRVGGKLMFISAEDDTVELVEGITAFDGDSITWTAVTTLDWPAGTEIYPVRSCIINQQMTNQRYPTNANIFTLQFATTDNAVNLYVPGTTTLAWDAIGIGDDTSKILMDDPNFCDTTIGETSDCGVVLVDGNTGALGALSTWLRARRGSNTTWATTDREHLWNVRVFLHFLNGRRVSFYTPTFQNDFTPVADLTSGSATMDVANAGIHLYNAVATSPHKYLRVEFVDGTKIIQQISSVAVISTTVERLTLATNWSASHAVETIARVTLLEKVRMDADDIVLTHTDLWGTCETIMPIKAVLE